MVRILISTEGEIIDVMTEGGNDEYISDQYSIFKEVSVGTGDTIKVVHETPPPPEVQINPIKSWDALFEEFRKKLIGKIGRQRHNILINHRYRIMDEIMKMMDSCYPLGTYTREVRLDGAASLFSIRTGLSKETALKFIETHGGESDVDI